MDSQARSLGFGMLKGVEFFMVQPDSSGATINEEVGTVISWPFVGYFFTFEGIRYMSLEIVPTDEIEHWKKVGQEIGKRVLFTKEHLEVFTHDYRRCGDSRVMVNIGFDPDWDTVVALKGSAFQASQSLKPHNHNCDDCEHKESDHILVPGEGRSACSRCDCQQYVEEGDGVQ